MAQTSGRSGRVVLVTGAGSGIGLATCKAAARSGFRVVAGVRPGARASASRRELAERVPGAEVLELDVTVQSSVDAAVAAVLERYGRFDALVNCAGVTIHGAVEDFGDEDVERIVGVNFIGPFRMIRAVVPVMRAQGGGHVVNVTSIGARTVSPYFNFYAATKHALAALSISLRYELEPFGIAVSMVEPGAVRTPISTKATVLAPDGSPYAAPVRAIAARVRAGLARGLDPDVPAGRIVALLGESAPPLRVPVGDDAIGLVAATRELDDADLFAHVGAHWRSTTEVS